MKLGFIGLGRMGRAIAARLQSTGHDLVVYNRTPAKCAELAAAGAKIAPSIAEACADREVVISMLSDDAALNEVTLGTGGLCDSMSAGSIHLAMGTHGVEAIRALACAHEAAGQILVAAPVLGRPDVAAAGQLGIVAAGAPEAMAKCAPLFQFIGRRTFQAGAAPEAAGSIKLANSFLLGCALEAMGEAFSLVRKFGVAPDVLYEVLTDGLFSAPAYKVYGRLMADASYDNAGFTTRLGLKDVNLVLQAGEIAQVPLPSANTVHDRLLQAMNHGEGERDWAVLAREQARLSGLD